MLPRKLCHRVSHRDTDGHKDKSALLMDRVVFVREIGLMSQCNMAMIFVFATERLVIDGKRRKGELGVTTEDIFFAIKQELEGRQSEESTNFGGGCS